MGGTAYAVYYALRGAYLGKPDFRTEPPKISLFNESDNKWYEFSHVDGDFIPSETPTIERGVKTAVIGTRGLKDANYKKQEGERRGSGKFLKLESKLAIESVFAKSFPNEASMISAGYRMNIGFETNEAGDISFSITNEDGTNLLADQIRQLQTALNRLDSLPYTYLRDSNQDPFVSGASSAFQPESKDNNYHFRGLTNRKGLISKWGNMSWGDIIQEVKRSEGTLGDDSTPSMIRIYRKFPTLPYRVVDKLEKDLVANQQRRDKIEDEISSLRSRYEELVNAQQDGRKVLIKGKNPTLVKDYDLIDVDNAIDIKQGELLNIDTASGWINDNLSNTLSIIERYKKEDGTDKLDINAMDDFLGRDDTTKPIFSSLLTKLNGAFRKVGKEIGADLNAVYPSTSSGSDKKSSLIDPLVDARIHDSWQMLQRLAGQTSLVFSEDRSEGFKTDKDLKREQENWGFTPSTDAIPMETAYSRLAGGDMSKFPEQVAKLLEENRKQAEGRAQRMLEKFDLKDYTEKDIFMLRDRLLEKGIWSDFKVDQVKGWVAGKALVLYDNGSSKYQVDELFEQYMLGGKKREKVLKDIKSKATRPEFQYLVHQFKMREAIRMSDKTRSLAWMDKQAKMQMQLNKKVKLKPFSGVAKTDPDVRSAYVGGDGVVPNKEPIAGLMDRIEEAEQKQLSKEWKEVLELLYSATPAGSAIEAEIDVKFLQLRHRIFSKPQGGEATMPPIVHDITKQVLKRFLERHGRDYEKGKKDPIVKGYKDDPVLSLSMPEALKRKYINQWIASEEQQATGIVKREESPLLDERYYLNLDKKPTWDQSKKGKELIDEYLNSAIELYQFTQQPQQLSSGTTVSEESQMFLSLDNDPQIESPELQKLRERFFKAEEAISDMSSDEGFYITPRMLANSLWNSGMSVARQLFPDYKKADRDGYKEHFNDFGLVAFESDGELKRFISNDLQGLPQGIITPRLIGAKLIAKGESYQSVLEKFKKAVRSDEAVMSFDEWVKQFGDPMLLRNIRDEIKSGSGLVKAKGSAYSSNAVLLNDSAHVSRVRMNELPGEVYFDMIEKLISNTPVFERNVAEIIMPTKEHKMYYDMAPSDNIWNKQTTTAGEMSQGTRTATTRTKELGKIGEVVKIKDSLGYYRVTKTEVITKKKANDKKWVEQWSKKEGWTVDWFNKNILPKIEKGDTQVQTTVERVDFDALFKKKDGNWNINSLQLAFIYLYDKTDRNALKDLNLGDYTGFSGANEQSIDTMSPDLIDSLSNGIGQAKNTEYYSPEDTAVGDSDYTGEFSFAPGSRRMKKLDSLHKWLPKGREERETRTRDKFETGGSFRGDIFGSVRDFFHRNIVNNQYELEELNELMLKDLQRRRNIDSNELDRLRVAQRIRTYSGKTGVDLDQAKAKFEVPFIERLQEINDPDPLKLVGDYWYARYAKTRNRNIEKLLDRSNVRMSNDNGDPYGSGMGSAEADGIIKFVENHPEFKRLRVLLLILTR